MTRRITEDLQEALGKIDSNGRQIRPNVVLFGEEIHHREVARQELLRATERF